MPQVESVQEITQQVDERHRQRSGSNSQTGTRARLWNKAQDEVGM
ncbi:hypothetical protein ACNKHT_20500 [Shigella flexneri]